MITPSTIIVNSFISGTEQSSVKCPYPLFFFIHEKTEAQRQK